MALWRLGRGWSRGALKAHLDAVQDVDRNFPGVVEQEMTGEAGWQHYHSEALIAMENERQERFARARQALASYQFSDPAIVVAHFDPKTPLLLRRILLEIKVMGTLRYLCPAQVTHVRDEADVYGFRYDTLEGHIERGVEWFLLTRNERGEIRFRIEARWRQGDFPNWWSRAGFFLISDYYQRRWHRHAHERMSLYAHYGSLERPPTDVEGLTHQGVDVTFTYHTKRRRFPR
jgi:uncharacterized protein (UPF0548 family)